jgi:NAD(P)-dependent dehydrogenase (short-subunit alcohol dehydrogenase family)
MRIHELFDLSGKLALITGGSRGLGLQIAHAYGEAGAKLVLVSRKQTDLDGAVRELSAAGHQSASISADLSDPAVPVKLVEQVLARHGQIDILVNNAGATWGAPTESHPLEAWNKVINLNLTGIFLLSQAVGKYSMLPRNAGKIVNLASIAGLVGMNPNVMATIAYNTSKGGLINFTRALAGEWASHGITVNAIAPGFIPTKMSQGFLDVHGEAYLTGVPMGRLGNEQDLKGVALLLASRASDYITGQVIAVDGGYTAL